MIYTTGYYGHQPEALKALAESLDATVVDIRFMPASRVPGWRKQALQKLLGDRYLWVQAFGNIHYNDGQPIQIADMAAGVKALVFGADATAASQAKAGAAIAQTGRDAGAAAVGVGQVAPSVAPRRDNSQTVLLYRASGVILDRFPQVKS